MALEDLGIRQVAVEDGWINFDPIELRNNRRYFLEINFSSNSPDLVYSNFVFRLSGTTELGSAVVSAPSEGIQISGVTTVIALDYSDYYANRSDVVFQVRRNSFFSEPSNLADVSVQLLVDPDSGDRL